ncbi:hypothetical protein M0R45_017198 [Rubus argutus]|uniref:Uncharacterized protein n=1 Tax=Rubus argutus TaxID=59490 RepID=A0AAW1XXM4_RUBAR
MSCPTITKLPSRHRTSFDAVPVPTSSSVAAPSPASPLRCAASAVLPSLHLAQAAPTTTPQQPTPFAAGKRIEIEEKKWSWPKEDEECNEEEEK